MVHREFVRPPQPVQQPIQGLSRTEQAGVVLPDPSGQPLPQRQIRVVGPTGERNPQWDRGIGIDDVPFVFGMCESITVMNFGRVIYAGSAADVAADPAVRAAYLGTETPGGEA